MRLSTWSGKSFSLGMKVILSSTHRPKDAR
jgi:hypothetical protein